MGRQVPVTAKQVLAARVRVAGDKVLDRETPAWIVKLAKTRLPTGVTLGHGPGGTADPEHRHEVVSGDR